jgi:hypothetical protein
MLDDPQVEHGEVFRSWILIAAQLTLFVFGRRCESLALPLSDHVSYLALDLHSIYRPHRYLRTMITYRERDLTFYLARHSFRALYLSFID